MASFISMMVASVFQTQSLSANCCSISIMTMRTISASEKLIKPCQEDISGLVSPKMSANTLPPARSVSAINPIIKLQLAFFILYQYHMNDSLTSQWTSWAPFRNQMVSTRSLLSRTDSPTTFALSQLIQLQRPQTLPFLFITRGVDNLDYPKE